MKDKPTHPVVEALTKPYASPTVAEPTIEEMMEWQDAATEENQATDGCSPVEPDGHCEHGHPSWLLYLGLI